jgi:hypothetical protein
VCDEVERVRLQSKRMNSSVNIFDEYLQRIFSARTGEVQRREAFLLQRSFHSPE